MALAGKAGAVRQRRGGSFAALLRMPGLRIGERVEAFLRLELRRAALWLPVGLGLGIWLYFALPAEPPDWTLWLPLPPAMLLLLPAVRRRMVGRVLVLGAFALTLGFALALGAAMRADGPRLAAPVTGTVEGRVIALDRAGSGAPRVLLERVSLFGYRASRVPRRVRVALLDTPAADAPRPGDWVHVYATLFPPSAPVEPGAFDFARRAYFQGLGATGFARSPAMRLPARKTVGQRAEPAISSADHLRLRFARARNALSDGIRAALPGAAGAFAAAIITGDRAGIAEADAEALRISSLAHLLAISGLHMGMLTGLVFTVVRAGLVLAGPVALHLPVKKMAAAAALVAGLGYLALSGGTVATQRAFVMVAVALVAVMLDRPAITLRALALAAAIVLALDPAALFDAGFQMSFAATTALVAAYEALRQRRQRRRREMEDKDAKTPLPALAVALRGATAVPRPLRLLLGALWTGLGALLLTSIVAGAATAPFSGVHFNRIAPWGLLANLAAVPVMGAWIAPMAVLAGLAAPFGLAGPMLGLMGLGIDWVLGVAHWVAALPGADAGVPAAPPWLLGAVALGGLWAAIWRGPWRGMGLAAAVLALMAARAEPPPRPAVIIAEGGRLIGVLGPEGRVLDRALGQGFAAETWLRRDGERPGQEAAAARPGFEADGERRALSAPLADGWEVLALRGRGVTEARLSEACGPRFVVIAPGQDHAPAGPCVFIGARQLAEGSVAVWITPEGTRMESSAPSGARRWHRGWRGRAPPA
ncbi:MAG: ComEC/Rec2 family competence protein [Pseudomonadota bacterium]